MNTNSFPYVVGTAVTTVVLFCGANTSQYHYASTPMPSDEQVNIDLGIAQSFDRYTLISNAEQQDNIEVIHNFAANLLENIEDIPADFSKAIDDNFWDLI